MSRRSARRNYERGANEDIEADVEDVDEELEDMEDDEQEVTRCVCGNDDLNPDTINEALVTLLDNEYQIKIDQGLFIQCDKCSVWQHGYCVGLYINEDVPDKYWCELCKPELHFFVTEGNNDSKRTLYKPVNEKRKKLMAENEKYNKRKFTRKDRRNYDYDEQLQKALRESAKEIAKEAEQSKRDGSREIKSDDNSMVTKDDGTTGGTPPSSSGNTYNEKLRETEVGDEEDDAEGDAEDEETNVESRKDVRKLKRARKKESRPSKKKAKTEPVTNNITKDELLNQASKPRFVNERSTIYESRKRISAILEWISRSQIELEEEKLVKQEMITDGELLGTFNENLGLMQALTGKILEWEEKYGKYAP